MPAIAYISSVLPKQSETFVYREVRELRRRGWSVLCVSLHRPTEPTDGLEDLLQGAETVYDGWPGMMVDASIEQMTHPASAVRSKLRMIGDVVTPGEPLRAADRLKLPLQWLAAAALARHLRRRSIQHIHCHFAHAPTSVGMYAAMHLRVPFSFTGHANDLFQRRQLLRRKLQRAAFVNCISKWHLDLYTRVAPENAANYHVVRCGVDVDGWKPAPSNPAAKPSTSDGIRLLTVCRLVEKKGVDNLLRGLGQFARGGGRFTLDIAGDGPQRAMLQAIAREQRIYDRVNFLGSIGNDRVRSLLQDADAFALTCRDDASGDRDGIPVVLMEAMACGLPVISGDLPAIRELVEHGKSGLLVDGTNLNQIADAIASIAADGQFRARLGAAGRDRVVQEFSLVENVSRIERLLEASIAANKLSRDDRQPIKPQAATTGTPGELT